MTSHADLPTFDEVSVAVNELFEEATELGARPSVLALARRLNIANTTLRRNYPDAVAAVSTHIRNRTEQSQAGAPPTRIERLERENARLRAHNRELSAQIDLASSQIRCLSLESHDLRQQLHIHSGVTSLIRNAPNG
jgi:hypothetical protein